MSASHHERIVEQFTQQAIPFAQLPGHLDSLNLLLELTRPTAEDTVLDLACGPGLLACAFARQAGQVTGMDLTPAMLEQAAKRQQEQGLTNLVWQLGDVQALPYADDSFSLVITRYSFHHLLDPQQTLAEMIRVCKPGGQVLVADVALPAEKAAAYDYLELLRDPSHTHALTTAEFSALFLNSGLHDCRQASYNVELELEAQLRASFPKPGDEERIRQMVTEDIGINNLGIKARYQDGAVVYSVPISVFVGSKGAA
ncbi:MAG: methyltransferase domain-containing protein [Geobacteraceae bacterium]|nr:methyltransferase domain-containing protein [Geobacteraceae bacterium]